MANDLAHTLDGVLDILRCYAGPALLKVGGAIVAAGIGTITGVLQIVIVRAVAYFLM